jgi:hypothetical protein
VITVLPGTPELREVMLGSRGVPCLHITDAETDRAELVLRGTARMTTVTISAGRRGPELQIAGSIPVTFSRWGTEPPAGSGILGSLADHGIAEFLLVLRA